MTVNGKMIESKGKEYSIGIREINMKEIGKNINRKENGDKRMGDFFNGEHVGKHVTLTKDGEVKAEYFSLKL